MPKRLTILVMWLLCAGALASQPSKVANSTGHDAKQGEPAILSEQGMKEHLPSQSNQVKADSKMPSENASIERFHWWSDTNVWLVIIAAITGSFICWQSWETHKSAEATRKSVELSADANSQWIKLKLLDMYSEVDKGQSDPPSTIMLKCRWMILNPSSLPLTLHKVKVAVERDDVWRVSEFDFEEVVPPGEDGKILIVPIPLNTGETAEYLEDGAEFSIAIGAWFSGVNGRKSYQHWGDLFYFRQGEVEWNASLGKGPQREYDEAFEDEGTLVPSGRQIYEFNSSPEWSKKAIEKSS